jgi:HEAT repeat protein
LAAQKIPKEDMPWVIENLAGVYDDSVDSRTRNFVVLALGSLNNSLSLPTLNKALQDQDPQVKFNAVVSLGNMSKGLDIDWSSIDSIVLQDQDPGLQQVALLTLASHQRPNTEEKALTLLNSAQKTLRYSSAIVLTQLSNPQAIPVLEELFALRYDMVSPGELNGAQVEALKMNALENIEKSQGGALLNLVQEVEKNDSNIRVRTKAKQVLKILKN